MTKQKLFLKIAFYTFGEQFWHAIIIKGIFFYINISNLLLEEK